MAHSFQALGARRDLLLTVAAREIKIKYKQSVMGFLWAILMPMLIVGAGILVRLGFARVSGAPLDPADLASVTVRAVPWAFVVGSIRFATNSLVSNANLVTKIYLPREIFPLASVLAQLVDFAVAATLVVVVFGALGVGASVHLFWVPVLVALLILQVTAVGLFLSAASLFFRDVKYLVEAVLTFAIFFTPVFYDADFFGSLAPVLLLNPVAPVLEGLADAVVHHQAPDAGWTAYGAATGLAGLWLGLRFFRSLEPYFAETV